MTAAMLLADMEVPPVKRQLKAAPEISSGRCDHSSGFWLRLGCRGAQPRSRGAVLLDRGEHRGRVVAPGIRGAVRGAGRQVATCVSWRRAVRLIFAGWLPQDGLFGWSARLSRCRA